MRVCCVYTIKVHCVNHGLLDHRSLLDHKSLLEGFGPDFRELVGVRRVLPLSMQIHYYADTKMVLRGLYKKPFWVTTRVY